MKNQTDHTEWHLPSIAMTQWIYSVKDNDEYKNRDFKSLVVRTSVLTICIYNGYCLCNKYVQIKFQINKYVVVIKQSN